MSIAKGLDKITIKSIPVSTQDEVDSLVTQLKVEFAPLEHRGFGLAGVQIGVSKQVAYLKYAGQELILVNTKIISKEDRVTWTEGCFSLPGLAVKTDRYQKIHILNGLTQEEYEVTGILAIAVQHEVDHFNGITMLERKHKAR